MLTGLDAVLKKLDVGNATFGDECKPPIARAQIWAYRNGKKMPKADTAANILETLKKRGVVLELKDILARRAESRARSTRQRRA